MMQDANIILFTLTLGIIPFVILTVINVKIFYAMRTLKHRLSGSRGRLVRTAVRSCW